MIRIFLGAAILMGVQSFAQTSSDINFKVVGKEITQDFGVVSSVDSVIHHTFRVINSDNKGFNIQSVTPSCDCVVLESWSKQEVAVGDTTAIDVQLKVYNRLGEIEKNIEVKTDIKTFTIKLKADVKKAALGTPYNYRLGNLVFESWGNYLRLKNESKEEIIEKRFSLKNSAGISIKVEVDSVSQKDYVHYSLDTDTLLPGENTYLNVRYDISKKKQYGNIQEHLSLITSDTTNPVKKVKLFFQIAAPNSSLPDSAQPKLYMSSYTIDLGSGEKGDTLTNSATINNTGKSSLIIENVVTNVGEIECVLDKTQIEPGASANITFTWVIHEDVRKGTQRRKVILSLNEVNHPVRIITLKAAIN